MFKFYYILTTFLHKISNKFIWYFFTKTYTGETILQYLNKFYFLIYNYEYMDI